jgi:integrase
MADAARNDEPAVEQAYFTTAQAAAILQMSAKALLMHVSRGNIRPDGWGKPRPCDLWGYETTRRRIHDVLDALGIELDSVTHMFRHTHVTVARALESDAVLRESVGHEAPAMTEHYTDESHRQARAVSHAGALESRLGGGVFGGASVTRLPKISKKTR